jgi:ABC-type molybdate transport system permease subunit
MTAVILVSATPWPSWVQLFFVGVILLPILLMHRERLSKARKVVVVLLTLALLVPPVVYGFDIAGPCSDWDALVNTFGYALAWWFWISWGC